MLPKPAIIGGREYMTIDPNSMVQPNLYPLVILYQIPKKTPPEGGVIARISREATDHTLWGYHLKAADQYHLFIQFIQVQTWLGSINPYIEGLAERTCWELIY